MFGFLKKKDDEAPPDVGKEDIYEAEKAGEKIEATEQNFEGVNEESSENENEESESEAEVRESYEDEKPKEKSKKKSKKYKKDFQDINLKEITDLEFEKINAKIEVFNSLIKGFNERFSNINQQLGELRGMVLENEKAITRSTQEAAKAVDIVKEVKPEKLRMDYSKVETKVNLLSEKLEATKQYIESFVEEVKDLKRKTELFIGSESLMKLNEDTKKDLIELKKLGEKVKINADKSEEIFVELKKSFTEYQKINEIVNNLDMSYSGLKKEVEKLRIDHSNIVKFDDFEDYKKKVNKRFLQNEMHTSEMDRVVEENEKIKDMVETILLMEKKNEKDIENIAFSLGEKDIKKVSEYDEKISMILDLMERITNEINKLKIAINFKEKKFNEKKFENDLLKEKSEMNFYNPESDFEINTEADIEDILLRGEALLKIGDVAGAKNLYKKLRDLYVKNKDSFGKEVYEKILNFYNSILRFS